MEKKDLVACLLAVLFGSLSVVLAFVAEAKKIKPSQVLRANKASHCYYPRSSAFGLGLASAILLLVAHVIVNVLTGCFCCRRRSSSSSSRCHWAISLVCFIVSWFTFVLAFLSLLGAAILNDQHTMDNMYFYEDHDCYVIKPGSFAGAAILALISTALGIISYLALARRKNTNNQLVSPGPNHSGIAMGHAQIPAVSQDPVFVHEDTYTRRQFT